MQNKFLTNNFVLLILGQITSLFGNFILKFALSMYILEATGSAAVFAGILAFSTIPAILLSPLGGILADRCDRKKVMVALDALSGGCVLCASLLFRESNAVEVIGVLLVALSVLGAFESPTVQACIPQLQKGDNVLKANAIVNQVAAIASLIAPLLGSVLYTAFGVKPVLYITILCFFLTAGFECFIRLAPLEKRGKSGESIAEIIRHDFLESIRFLGKDQPGILKLLLLATSVSFFVVGAIYVGLPFIVRNVLGMSAGMYGAAESLTGFSAILGSIAAGLLTGKLKFGRLHLPIFSIGVFFVLSGMIFLFPAGAGAKYAVILAAFCGLQIAVCIFSIFALTHIQQKTPLHLLGKVMAYVTAISMCSQPLSQTLYGFLFDRFKSNIELIFIPTGLCIAALSFVCRRFFRKLD